MPWISLLSTGASYTSNIAGIYLSSPCLKTSKDGNPTDLMGILFNSFMIFLDVLLLISSLQFETMVLHELFTVDRRQFNFLSFTITFSAAEHYYHVSAQLWFPPQACSLVGAFQPNGCSCSHWALAISLVRGSTHTEPSTHPEVLLIMEWQNGLGWRDLKNHPVPPSLS